MRIPITEKQARWGVIGLMILFVLVIFLLLPSGYLSAETYVTPINLPITPDSLWFEWRKDAVTYDRDTVTSSPPTDTAPSWELGDDTLHQIVLHIWYPGEDSSTTWTFQRDLRSTAGTRDVSTPARWSYATDSVICTPYIDGGALTKTRRSAGEQSYDTTYATINDLSYMWNYKIYPQGSATPLNWVWQAYFDTTGSTNPGYAGGTYANVLGRIRRPDGSGVFGARVTAYRTAGDIAVDTTSGNGVMFVTASQSKPTDTSGSFTLTLMSTSAYTDTTLGFYNIIINLGSEKLAEVKRLHLPTTGVYLGDIIAER